MFFNKKLGSGHQKINKISFKIYQKSIKKVIDNNMDVGMDVGSSWIDFLSILGPFWEASWHQVGTKIKKKRVPRRVQKMSGKKELQQIQDKLRRGGIP